MYSLAVHVTEGLPFAQDLSLENSAASYLYSRLALLHSVSFFFFLYWYLVFVPSFWFYFIYHRLGSLDQPICCFCDFGDFNVHHTDLLTYSGGSDSSGELCYDFSASNNLTQVVNFPIRIPESCSHSPALLDFFSLMLVFVIWLFLHREILLLLSIIFTTGCLISLQSLWLFLCWLGLLCDHLSGAPWEDIFKLSDCCC